VIDYEEETMKNFYISQKQEYDAIVVGSGITGGWAAKELTGHGLKTLVLERGRHVEHGKDYITEDVGNWEFRFRGMGDRKLFEAEYQVQSQCYAFGEATRHFFVNDKENPYAHDPDKPFSWIRGYHLGGRSLMWGRQCYRWSDLDFEANARDGFGVDWPIRYKDIEPWYDYVEPFVGISGSAEGIPHLPDGKFLPPMEMNCAELHIKEHIEKAFPGRKMIIGRVAVLTVPHNGRGRCHYCGPCHRGCSVGAYFSSLSSTLPAARATGNLTIRCNSVVHSVIYDEEKDKAVGVRVIDAETKAALEFYGRIIFLCASTLASTQILLNSSTPRFPNGLANSSGALGHYLMDHPYEAGATGEISGFEDRYYSGNRPNGIYIPRFRNLDDKTRHADFLRGYGCQGGARRLGWDRGLITPGFGVEFKQALRQPGPWEMWLGGWGEHLPRHENYVDLDPERKDAWGIPVLRIHCKWSDNENKMREDMATALAEMLEACGARNIKPFILESPPGLCIHEMGTARMGRDPKTSVLNAHNQSHDVPNVFVTDGAAMTSSACQNPSITYMALTARACNYAVEEMKRGNL
jgi:choline dehydrogenase-like flavoprotein